MPEMMDWRIAAINYAVCGAAFTVLLGWWLKREGKPPLPPAAYPVFVLIWLPFILVVVSVVARDRIAHHVQMARIRFALWQLRRELVRARKRKRAVVS